MKQELRLNDRLVDVIERIDLVRFGKEKRERKEERERVKAKKTVRKMRTKQLVQKSPLADAHDQTHCNQNDRTRGKQKENFKKK